MNEQFDVYKILLKLQKAMISDIISDKRYFSFFISFYNPAMAWRNLALCADRWKCNKAVKRFKEVHHLRRIPPCWVEMSCRHLADVGQLHSSEAGSPLFGGLCSDSTSCLKWLCAKVSCFTPCQLIASHKRHNINTRKHTVFYLFQLDLS